MANNTISLSCHEQVCLSVLRFERYFPHHDGRSISRNVAHLNILVHDMINLLYYEYWTDKQKYLYVYLMAKFFSILQWITGKSEDDLFGQIVAKTSQ